MLRDRVAAHRDGVRLLDARSHVDGVQAHLRPAVQAGVPHSRVRHRAHAACRPRRARDEPHVGVGPDPVRRRARSADPLDGQGRALRGEPRARGVPEARRRLQRTPRRGRPRRRSHGARRAARGQPARHVRRGHPAADRGDRRREAGDDDDRARRGRAGHPRGRAGDAPARARAVASRDVRVRRAAPLRGPSIRARGDRSPRLGAQAAAALRAVDDRGRAAASVRGRRSRRERRGRRPGAHRARSRSAARRRASAP